jgi:hypothetical protein
MSLCPFAEVRGRSEVPGDDMDRVACLTQRSREGAEVRVKLFVTEAGWCETWFEIGAGIHRLSLGSPKWREAKKGHDYAEGDKGCAVSETVLPPGV